MRGWNTYNDMYKYELFMSESKKYWVDALADCGDAA